MTRIAGRDPTGVVVIMMVAASVALAIQPAAASVAPSGVPAAAEYQPGSLPYLGSLGAKDADASVGAASSAAASLSDLDQDGLDDTLEQSLIDAYRPWYRYDSHQVDSDDKWPCSVSWFIDRSSGLRYYPTDSLCNSSELVYTQAQLQANPLLILQGEDNAISPPRPPSKLLYEATNRCQGYRLDLPAGPGIGERPIAHDGTYAHVTTEVFPDNAPDYLYYTGPRVELIVIQYYQFFAYNDAQNAGGLGDHEGDWELLDVYVQAEPPHHPLYYVHHHHGDSNCTPTVTTPAYFTFHYGDPTPICFLEEDAHEWWPFPGSGNDCSIFYGDSHDGEGLTYRAEKILNLGEMLYPMPAQEAQLITGFNGRWGNTEDLGFLVDEESPPGPPLMHWAVRYCEGICTPPLLISPTQAETCPGASTTLSWSRATLVDNYRVQVSRTPDFEGELTYDAYISRDLTSAVPHLEAGTLYYWRVGAVSSCCPAGAFSTFRFFRTEVIPPIPTPLSPADDAAALPTSGILDWSDSPGATRYGVSIRCGSNEVVASSTTLITSQYTYSLPDGTYHWYAVAYNSCGLPSGRSPTETFTVGAGCLTELPRPVTPADGAVCLPVSGVLRWEAVPGAAGYEVELGRHKCGDVDFTFHVTGTEAAYSGLHPGELYYWRVREECGCAPWSECSAFGVADDWNRIPSLVSPSNGATDQYTIGTLAWNGIAEADSYRVQIGTRCGAGLEYTGALPQFEYSGLQANTEYLWRVRARGGHGTNPYCPKWGDYSECDSFGTGNGTNRVYVAQGLSLERGQTGVMIPIRGENTAELKRLTVEVSWDADVFDNTGWTTTGTKADGAFRISPGGDSNTLRLDVRYAENECPPSIPSGDGVLFYVLMSVKGNATLGSTSISVSAAQFEGCAGRLTPLAFGGTVTITGSGTDQYYFPSGLAVMPGQPVVVPVRAENLLPMREYRFRVRWDGSVFDYLGSSLEGTKGENSAGVDSIHGADYVRFRVQQPCPPGFLTGDGEIGRIVLRAKSGAPLGPTVLIFDGGSENNYTDCSGHRTDPTTLSGVIRLVDGTTAIAVVTLSAEVEAGLVRLRWNVPDARGVCIVQRRTAGNDWGDLGLASFESPAVVAYDDRAVSPGERYAYRLFVQTAIDQGYSNEVWMLVPTIEGAPLALQLDPSFPNPFQTQTTLNFGIPSASWVKLGIYNVAGRRVAMVIERSLPAGWRSATWDGRDTSGHPVASGTYFARLESAGRVEIRKIVVTR